MEVGIRELKRRLSELVDYAARGEVIRVTDRGRPKAVLGPLPGTTDLKAGIEQGWVRPAKRTPTSRRRPRARAERTVSEVLAEDRGA